MDSNTNSRLVNTGGFVGDITGNVTGNVTGGITLPAAAVAAAGSAQGDAAVVASGFTHATAADGTKGVILPTLTAGSFFIIKNSDAANAILKVYPPTGATINALAANAAISMAAKTSAIFIALSSTACYTVPLLPS